MDADEYITYDATALARLVAAGEVTAAELLAAAQARADAVNPAVNAVVRRMDDLAAARAAGPLSGPFAGVPFLLKDLGQEYAGVPATYGSRSLAANVPTRNAVVVDRWLDAGLVVFGRTNTPEFGAKGITESTLWGPARNPWDTARTPGGSSGGSAAAVAAGIVPAAGASDGGGSIRIPSACCGLFGLKASRGLVPAGPERGEHLFGLATDGVVSRTVRDSAALLAAVVGPEPTAAYVTPPPSPLGADLERPPARLRIGFSAASALRSTPHPEAVAAVSSAAALLADLGHEVEEVPPPYDDEALSRDFLTIWFASMAAIVADARATSGAGLADFEADTLAVAELGRAAGVVAAFTALERRHAYVASLADFHSRYDYLLTPTLAEPPLLVGALDSPRVIQEASRVVARVRAGSVLARLPILDSMISQNLGWVPYTQLANLTGLPAMNVPLHRTAADLPLGVQFVGRLGAEAAMLRLAAQLEAARPWDRTAAPLTAAR